VKAVVAVMVVRSERKAAARAIGVKLVIAYNNFTICQDRASGVLLVGVIVSGNVIYRYRQRG
jgi:hypothetical protein